MGERHRLWGQLLAVALVCLLAACGEAPNPFRGAQGATKNNPLLDVPSAVGIAVLPLEGATAPFSQQVSLAVANRLQTLEIPAEAVVSNAGLGFTLRGTASNLVTSPSGVTLTVTWTLHSRRGETTSTYSQNVTLPAAAWSDGDPVAATRVGDEAGTAVANMIGAGTPVQAAGPVRSRYPSISIKPMTDAPGDGNVSLRLALVQVMFEKGVRNTDVNPEVVLTCSLTSVPFGDDRQKVQIVWKAVTSDGREMGTVKLDNTIPNGALEGPWGPTAFAIANAAINDLLKLLTVTPAAPAAPTP